MNPLRSLIYFSLGFLASAAFLFASEVRASSVIWSSLDGVVIRAPSGVLDRVDGIRSDPFFRGGSVTGSAQVGVAPTARLKAGGNLPIEVYREAKAPALARAARIAARSSGPLILVSAGLWVYEELTDRANPLSYDPDHGFISNTGATVYEWRAGQYSSQVRPTAAEACSVAVAGGTLVGIWSNVPTGGPQVLSGLTCKHPTSSWMDAPMYVRFISSTATTGPATVEEIEDAIMARLPTGSNATDLLRELIREGHIPDLDPIETSGPASVTGETTTSTVETPQGTTTTTNTTNYDISYQGDTITITRTDVTTTTHPDNTTETTTTTTEGGTEDSPAQEYGLDYADSVFPEVPELYEQKYPDGFAGVWSERLTEIQATPLFSAVSGFTSGGPSSGTCPTWDLSLNFGFVNFGTYTLGQDICYVWPFVRIVLLITAFFVARRLVFGG